MAKVGYSLGILLSQFPYSDGCLMEANDNNTMETQAHSIQIETKKDSLYGYLI